MYNKWGETLVNVSIIALDMINDAKFLRDENVLTILYFSVSFSNILRIKFVHEVEYDCVYNININYVKKIIFQMFYLILSKEECH